MTWARVDDMLWAHRKVRLLCKKPDGLAALGLWTIALSFCGKADKGSFSSDDLDHFGAVAGLKQRRCLDLITRLVEVGLLTDLGEGWAFHDWDVYQPSREYRQAQSERGKRGAEARWNGTRHKSAIGEPHGGGANATANGESIASRSDPIPTRSNPIRSDARARAGDFVSSGPGPDPERGVPPPPEFLAAMANFGRGPKP